jgi:hypothetical protein
MSSRRAIRCLLGHHRIVREPVWNQGFYFAACARCGCDLVRMPGERWHEPRGARVVWRETPPDDVPSVRILRRGAQPPNPLPLNGRLAEHFRVGRQVPSAANAQQRSRIPDFMDNPDAPLM